MRGLTGMWVGLQRKITRVPPQVNNIVASPFSAPEGSIFTFTVDLEYPYFAPLSFPIVFWGSAIPGTHYIFPPVFSHGVTLSGSNIIVPAGVSSFTITVTSIDDAVVNGNRDLAIDVGAVSDAVVIQDNDTPSGMPLDGLTPGWYFWCYALRRLLTAYTGPLVRVRRTSDNAEQDIGYTTGGGLDTAALLSFVGSSDGRVVTWYNQSGISGRDLTSFGGTGGSRQPLLVQGGVIQTLPNGKPAVRWDPAPDPNARNLSWGYPFGSGVSGVWAQAAFKYDMVAPPAAFPYYSRLISFADTRGGSDVDGSGEIALVRMRTLDAIPRIAHERLWVEYNMHVIPDLTVSHRVMAYIHATTQTAQMWFDGSVVGTTTDPALGSFSGSNYFRLGSATSGGSASEQEQWSGLISFAMLTVPAIGDIPPPSSNLALVNAFMQTEYGTP